MNRILIKQLEQSDCGIACLATIQKYYNADYNFERLRELSGTNKTGTSLLGLYQAANQIGFNASGKQASSIEDLQTIKSPVILHVILEKTLLHYYVFFGFNRKGQVIVGDPAKGILILSKEQLSEIWCDKYVLELIPNEELESKQKFRQSRIKWFKELVKDDMDILYAILFLGVTTAILNLSTAIFTQKLIDEIIPSRNSNMLITGLSLTATLLLIQSLIMFIRGRLIVQQYKAFNSRVISNFYRVILRLPKSFFDTRKVGELTTRMNDGRLIQNTVGMIAGSFLIDGLVLVVFIIGIFIYSRDVGFVILIALPLYLLLIVLFNKRIINSQADVLQSYAHNESNYIDSITGISTIKSFNREFFFQGVTESIYDAFQSNVVRLGKVKINYSVSFELLGGGLIIGIFGVTAFQVLNGLIKIGEMVAIISLTGSIIPVINRLSNFNVHLQEAKIAFERLYEFARIKPEYESKDDPDNADAVNADRLMVTGLSFRFPGQHLLLNDITFEVKKNEFTILLGESGSGKSTIIQILQKFYTPESGNILLDDLDFRNIKTDKWRGYLGIVPQQIKIFNGTLIDNIGLGNDTSRVIEFCRVYSFDTYFLKFPQGYSTVLGENGVNISGGQRQLVALARALYREPRILLLDEATSAMDRNTENFILELLSSLKNDIAILMITHRIKTASRANYVYILENGTISAKGTPEELMLSKNFYSDCYNDLVVKNGT